ncbi:MAG: aldo/keto reductase [Flavobacteriales bacterium]|nr:aldo/keto reductase [Flavobacteriales bacterium]
MCKELGITYVAYSPLGRGFLTGAIKSRADLAADDWRLTLPRFTEEAIQENLRFVEVLDEMARDKGVTKAQLALAWVLKQNEGLAAIPGTRRIERLQENLGAYDVDLSADELEAIDAAMPAETVGTRY